MSVKLSTPVTIHPHSSPISHQSNILMLGSCFSENIGEKLLRYRFRVCSNPTGILYNPGSITAALSRILAEQPFTRSDLFLHEGLWKSWHHHTRFVSPQIDTALQNMNSEFIKAVEYIKNLDCLLITLGTASVYYHQDTHEIVANCHKFPHSTFYRHLMTPDGIIDQFCPIIYQLLTKNPSMIIGFTLSPVRYLKDGLHQNLVSKSHLISAIYALEQKYPQIYYFPAYEIMTDELRDYRFYDQDLVHPNCTAISIIWERFQQAFISESSKEFINKYTSVLLAREHRIQHAELPSTKAFANSQLNTIRELNIAYPYIDLNDDISYFSRFC